MNNRKFKTGLKTSINDFEDLAPHEAWKDEIAKHDEKRNVFIAKLIEKYEAKISECQAKIWDFTVTENNAQSAKIEVYQGFISDLKQLQQNTGD